MHSDPARQSHRQMTQSERELLDAFLAHDFEGVEGLRTQAATTEVSPSCGCGCGSLGFSDGQRAGPPRTPAVPVPIEGVVLGEGGDGIGGLLLFVRDGRMVELEVYANEDRPLPLPDLDHVRWIEIER